MLETTKGHLAKQLCHELVQTKVVKDNALTKSMYIVKLFAN